MRANRQHRQRGFTILELMMATGVFSVVLLLLTAGIIQISRVYYKGVIESSTQNAARTILETVSQAIQFSGEKVVATKPPVSGTDQAFCIGNQEFSYRLGWQVENTANPSQHQLQHGLVQRSFAGSDCVAQDLSGASVGGRELLGEHMRLSNIVVQNLDNNLYRVQVRVVYGDDDLLNNPTGTDASCNTAMAVRHFCAVSELSTVVVKRVQ